tara:strand:- start:8438 stop:9385 length:948 start_codon:yes stop_codon:yes gene_type:complete
MINKKALFGLIVMFFSCNNEAEKILPDSNGNINNISVVIDDNLWAGEVGKAIRENIAPTIYGLPQIEQVFDLRQIPPNVFSGFVRSSRSILKIDISKEQRVFTLSNPYAYPQKVIQITAKNPNDLIDLIKKNKNKIYSVLYYNELQEKQRRISKSLNKTKDIKINTGVQLKIPSAYRVAKSEKNFVWIRRDIKTGSVNLLVSKLKSVNKEKIIHVRDSVSRNHIPGPVDNTYMSTDMTYKPNIDEILIGDKKAYETRGLWEVENQFMAGPFINFLLKSDEQKDEYIMIDGFVYSPGSDKREYIFELEAIIRSLSF